MRVSVFGLADGTRAGPLKPAKRLDAQPCAEIAQTGSSCSKRASPFLDKRPCPNHECERETWTQLFSAENTRSDLFSLAEAYNAHIIGMCILTILN